MGEGDALEPGNKPSLSRVHSHLYSRHCYHFTYQATDLSHDASLHHTTIPVCGSTVTEPERERERTGAPPFSFGHGAERGWPPASDVGRPDRGHTPMEEAVDATPLSHEKVCQRHPKKDITRTHVRTRTHTHTQTYTHTHTRTSAISTEKSL